MSLRHRVRPVFVVFGLIQLLTAHLALAGGGGEIHSVIDLSDIPAPFCFKNYCVLKERREIIVGGGQIVRRLTDGTRSETRPVENDLLSVFFTDCCHGTVVGTHGLILQTVDGGETWSRRASHTDLDFQSATCPDLDYCWIAGQKGTLMHTEDKGHTWKRAESGTEKDLNAIDFLDLQRGWAVGEDGLVLQTSDGGKSWNRFQATITLFPDSRFAKTADLQAVKFFDSDVGLVAGAGGIARTADGGKTWRPVLQGLADKFIGFVSHDKINVWAVGDGDTPNYCSGDGGLSWKACGSKAKTD